VESIPLFGGEPDKFRTKFTSFEVSAVVGPVRLWRNLSAFAVVGLVRLWRIA